MEPNEQLTESELRKKAYLIGLRLKDSGLDAETIFARLDKAGIPEAMAKQVVNDVLIERKKDDVKEAKPVYNVALIRIGIGVIIALVSYLIFPGKVMLPIGIIGGGLIMAFLAKRRM